MNKSIASIGVITGTITSLLMSTSSATAAVFNWSYTTEGNDVYTGMLEGDIQGDGNTVEVTSVFMTQLNGSNLPETSTITDSFATENTMGFVTLDNSLIDFGACNEATLSCENNGIFISLDFGFFTANGDFSPETGDLNESFALSRWDLTEKASVTAVPEPSLTFALIGLGLSTLIKTSVKNHLKR